MRPLDRPSPATSAISVGSSSPAPVLLARQDTGHTRRRSSGAGLKSSVPIVPLNHGERAQYAPENVASDRTGGGRGTGNQLSLNLQPLSRPEREELNSHCSIEATRESPRVVGSFDFDNHLGGCALLDLRKLEAADVVAVCSIGGAAEKSGKGASPLGTVQLRPGRLRFGGGTVNVPARQRQWFPLARLLIDHQAATSSTSVGSSSPMPVLLTRLDTGHMRNLSLAAEFSNSVPRPPLNQGPKSASSRITGMRS